MLNSFEERCIIRVEAVNSFTRNELAVNSRQRLLSPKHRRTNQPTIVFLTVSSILLSIPCDLNSALVWTASFVPLILSSQFLYRSLGLFQWHHVQWELPLLLFYTARRQDPSTCSSFTFYNFLCIIPWNKKIHLLYIYIYIYIYVCVCVCVCVCVMRA